MVKKFKIEDLQRIFNQTFQLNYRTILEYGSNEPFYESAKNENDFHRIISRSDFFASALHEISHWCIAGKERRGQDDFGYWYNPDGRNLEEQLLFEKCEIKPQALEWIFSLACNCPFEVSVDNLSLSDYDSSDFKERVYAQLSEYRKTGLPGRAEAFVRELEAYYNADVKVQVVQD